MLAESRLVMQLAIGLVFLSSAVAKLSNPRGFARGVADYQLVPQFMVGVISVLIVALEIWLAVTHLAASAVTIIFVLGLGTLVVFGFAVAVNLRRGRALPCHCFGGSGETISNHTLIRLALLASGEIFLIATNQFQHDPEQIVRFPDLALALFWALLLLLAGLWFLSLRNVLELLRTMPPASHRGVGEKWPFFEDSTKRVAQE